MCLHSFFTYNGDIGFYKIGNPLIQLCCVGMLGVLSSLVQCWLLGGVEWGSLGHWGSSEQGLL